MARQTAAKGAAAAAPTQEELDALAAETAAKAQADAEAAEAQAKAQAEAEAAEAQAKAQAEAEAAEAQAKAQAEAEAAEAATKAEAGPMVRVRSRSQAVRRRAGRSFGAQPIDIPLAELSQDEVDQLVSDPQLLVENV